MALVFTFDISVSTLVIAMRSTTKPLHIMVTDINQHVRDLLKRELEKEGHSVVCVKSGLEAYHAICDAGRLDLVILDPELLNPYGQTLFPDVLANNPSLQIIVHTYSEFARGLTPNDHVHIVLKDASSIDPLKARIRACSIMKSPVLPQRD